MRVSIHVFMRAMIFDVFGTCVDWRTSIEWEATRWQLPEGFADAWRAQYQPQLETVRSGRRPWVNLDVLHRIGLDKVLADYGIDLPEGDRQTLVTAWHRLDPWTDTVKGLTALKAASIIAPCSNGHIALIVNMAKSAGLPWDLILGAEIARAYKPQPEAYLAGAAALKLQPRDIAMVAAHNGDLKAAQALGFRTAFVPRPTEHGPDQTTDLEPEGAWDVVARDFLDLAAKLKGDCPL
jgi:2-haloacid dehalogenase